VIWLTWRQCRTQFIVVYGLVAAACVWLALTGPQLARLASRNEDVYDLLTSNDKLLFNGGIAALAIAPAVIGIFWGAPLVARELETGTYRLAWNQSVTRGRWLAVKLGFSVLAIAVAVAILSAAITWWAQPLDGATSSQRGSLATRLTPISFAMRGIVPVGYAMFALALGTLVGLILRRTVSAMAVTLAIYVLVQIAMPLWVRPHLVPPTTESVVISEDTLDGINMDNSATATITISVHSKPGDWILTNQTVDAQGRPAAIPAWFSGCVPPPPRGDGTANFQAAGNDGKMGSCLARLADEGYRQHLVYQPSSHFWPLQWAETGLFVAASAVLAWLSFWWTRRRLS
jgi:ABC-type transport system involved in multi-copper enzyme maturation permease subunit